MNSHLKLLQNTVNLVPREEAPRGFQLVSADKVGKKNQFDLVELAEVVQKADQFTRATAGSKLTVIAEQVHARENDGKHNDHCLSSRCGSCKSKQGRCLRMQD